MKREEIVPHWKLERYVLGELPESEIRTITDRLEYDTVLSAHLAEILESDVSIAEEYSPEWVLRQVKLKSGIESVKMSDDSAMEENDASELAASTGGGITKLFSTLSMVVLVAVVVVYFNAGNDGLRTKGLGPYLELYKKSNDATVYIEDGGSATQGDLIQLHYLSKDRQYGVIASVDGNGVVTMHLPTEGSDAVSLTLNTKTSLPFSYELDDAPRYERFYFITAKEAFKVSLVQKALEKGVAPPPENGFLKLDKRFFQYTTTIIKGEGNE
ncbi:MAG: hypothetical protein OCD01_10985 [Fibrobacterales bacterium]